MKKRLFCLSLAYAAGSLLSYPPFNLGWLSLISLLPLFFLLETGVSALFYLGLTLLFNLLYFLWLARTNIPGWFLLSLFFTCSSLPGFFLLRYFLRRRWLVALSFLLVFFEYIRVASDYALPFQISGYTQWNIYSVRQLASIGGVWLVSWFLYSVNLIFFDLLRRRRLRWLWLLVLLALLAAANYPQVYKYKDSIRVALIQTNLRLDTEPLDEDLFWQTYTGACLAAARQNPELYIWPEVALYKSLREDKDSARRLRELLTALDAGIILGNRDSRNFDLRFNNNYNAVFYIDKGGMVRGTHYKQKLIPFMETANDQLPLLPYFIRNKLQAGIYRKGADRELFTLKPGLKIAPLICYEAVSGRYVREFTRQQPAFIINVSSDGWSRSLTEHQLNLYFNVFRAVENRMYLVRVAEDGISAVISPQGDILAALPAFTSGHIVRDIPY
ncbi:MAG: apolipoprotein N-acyltransferase [Candidatus Margulisbacteria bacterium]|jgi:apolipoprotein N-acyltransferase|nr:apolipoprotein N-acyltransferase [Candidatus Margulisiibacteriota bacterium]